jgi:plastocyanin
MTWSRAMIGPCAVLLALAVGTIATQVGATADAVVTIANFTFKADTITVHAGARVTFRNTDDIPHSVVMADGSFRSRVLDTDEETTIAFAKVGNYAYFCGLHPRMQGKVSVLP